MDNTQKTSTSQIASPINGTSTASPQKPLPPRKQQAVKLVNLYQEIKETGVIPEPESYKKDLGDLATDMDELIHQYRLDGAPGINDAFIALARSNKNVMWAAANASPAQEQEEKPPEADIPKVDEKKFVALPEGKRILRLYSIEEAYDFADPEYLITRILAAANVSLLYGVSGTGKTFTSLDVALTIAHGINWCGRKVKQGHVWYINAEGNRSFKKRLRAWYKEHSELTSTSYFHLIPWAVDLKENFQDILATITHTIETSGETPVLIIIDNFSTCADIDQTKQELVSAALKNLNMLAQEYGPHVMIVHHTNKVGDFNGSMAFRNHVDTMIELVKRDEKDKNSPILFCIQKNRDEDPLDPITLEVKQIELYTDQETLEPVTSRVVVMPTILEVSQAATQDENDIEKMLEILNFHKRLSTNGWRKHCIAVGISERQFNRLVRRTDLQGKVSFTPAPKAGRPDTWEPMTPMTP